jgi:fructose 1,6-bisphosphatase
MNVKDVGTGISIGLIIGSFSTALALAKPVRDIIVSDKAYKARQKAMFEHFITTMGPYVPKHILEENLEYMQFDSIVTHEEGSS